MAKVGEEFLGSWEERAYNIATASALAVASSPVVFAIGALITLDPTNPTHQPFYSDLREGGSEGEMEWLEKLKLDEYASEEERQTAIEDYETVQSFLNLLPEGGETVTKLMTIYPGSRDRAVTFGSKHPGRSWLAKALKLRELSLDELTGFYDVIRGRYSLIGRRLLQLEDHLAMRKAVGEATHDAWVELPGGLAGRGQNARHRYENPMSKEAWQTSAELDLDWAKHASVRVNTQVALETPRDLLIGAIRPEKAEDHRRKWLAEQRLDQIA